MSLNISQCIHRPPCRFWKLAQTNPLLLSDTHHSPRVSTQWSYQRVVPAVEPQTSKMMQIMNSCRHPRNRVAVSPLTLKSLLSLTEALQRGPPVKATKIYNSRRDSSNSLQHTSSDIWPCGCRSAFVCGLKTPFQGHNPISLRGVHSVSFARDGPSVVGRGVFSPAHGPSTELGSAGYPAESFRDHESGQMGISLVAFAFALTCLLFAALWLTIKTRASQAESSSPPNYIYTGQFLVQSQFTMRAHSSSLLDLPVLRYLYCTISFNS